MQSCVRHQKKKYTYLKKYYFVRYCVSLVFHKTILLLTVNDICTLCDTDFILFSLKLLVLKYEALEIKYIDNILKILHILFLKNAKKNINI